MTYGPMTKRIKKDRGSLGEVMSSYERGEARGITSGKGGTTSRSLVKKRNQAKDYAAQSPRKLDFFSKFLALQDDRFNKMKEFKTANADGFTDSPFLPKGRADMSNAEYNKKFIKGTGRDSGGADLVDPQVDFLKKLKMMESSGRKDVVNSRGYMGLYQVGDDRLAEFKKGTGFKFTKKEFLAEGDLQESFAAWHITDIDALYDKRKIKMPRDSFRAVAHLGGKEGALKYAKTRHLPIGHPEKYNKHDGGKKKDKQGNPIIGTWLHEYDEKFDNTKDK